VTASPITSLVPPEHIVAAHVDAVRSARPREDRYLVQRAALLLAGLDRPDVDEVLRAFALTLPAREEWEKQASRATVGRALDEHGAQRVLMLAEDLWDLHAFAWWQPRPVDVMPVMERLHVLSGVMAKPVGAPLIPLVQAHLARGGGGAYRPRLAELVSTAWLQDEAVATTLGTPPPSCRLVSTVRPAWVPHAHAVELRDPLTACLRRQVLHGLDWRAPVPVPNIERPLAGRGLVLLDVDHMKHINDVHGLLAGDCVLRAAANRLQECVGDRVLRFGGEEFLVVWEGGDVSEVAARLVEEIASLEVVNPYGDPPVIPVTVSAGSSLGDELLSTLRRADEGVLQAKRSGRRRAVHVP
jgi:diguanylate cyclase (GGDEF)-like protein